MKKKEKTQLQATSIADLQKQVTALEKTITEKMRDRATKQVKNVHEIKDLRKKVARVKTFIRQKELVNE